ncbi:3-keto-disaccharide hydrolase [Olivibacter domesticus]|uniref:3-keto-alpha-glucoside-1,2-lyase/3-keto-2-hydroxy-glucal hydratase domain-containing protein n=1 Tax=Olivibacter domesticus TaxID=407022 RepID=A0A1H7XZB4_OLID1|nr:DUF1080 domain-containing protein [Olivibacter domesticus]SEM38299.1 protein of unknown function [Olivibacter domesticus]
MKKTIKYLKRSGLLVLFPVMIITACGQSNADKQKDTPTDNEQADSGFVHIFDGKTLDGWEGDSAYWRVEDGMLIGERKASDKPLERNTFIIWKGGEPADFELTLMYKISPEGNSGINYRSDPVASIPNALKGYQADIDGKNKYTGQNYEERKRTTLAYRGQAVEVPDDEQGESKNNAWTTVIVKDTLGDLDKLKSSIKEADWNECRIVAKGNRLQHYVNGILMSDVVDNDTKNRKMSGSIGVQIHVGPPMQVAFKDIKLKTL